MFRLYDSAVVREWKRAAKVQARSTGLKIQRPGWRSRLPGERWAIFIFWFAMMATRATLAKNVAWLLAAVALFCGAIVLSEGRKVHETLTASSERLLSWTVPMPDELFVAWRVKRLAIGLWWLAFVLVLIYLRAGYLLGGAWGAEALAFAAIEWLVVICAALAVAPYSGMIPKWLPIGFYVAIAASFYLPGQYDAQLHPFVDVLPTGWVNFALLHLEPRAALVAGAVSAPFVVGAAWLLLQRQIDLYRKANTAPEAVEWVRDFENEPAEGEQIELGELAEPTQVATTADENALPMQAAWNKMRDDEYGEHVGDFLRSGTWLTGWNWQRLGWIERLVGRLLNEKERERIQFMLGSEAPTWSKSWRTSAIVTAVAFVPLAIPMPGTRGIGSIIAVIALLFGVPVLGGRWIGSAQGPVTGKLVPILSFYPVDYRKTSVAIWKVNLLRAVLWAPFGLALGILVARDMRGSPEPWTNGVWFTARVLLTVIAVMPVMVAVTFSKSSNDTGTDSIRGAAVLALVTIGGVFLLTLAGIGLTTPWPWSAAAIITLAVTAWAMWSSYGAYYEKGKVDLVRTRE